MTESLRIFIVAGEQSGDRLGAALMRRLHEECGDLTIAGVGGEAMAAEGLESLFPISDVAVMGLTEVVGRIPTVLRRAAQTAAAAAAFRPDILLTIDAPGFAAQVWKRFRKRAPGVPIAHYVAPSVWAWKPWRARRIARQIDHLMALLPFEPPYFRTEGLSCDFTGHPVVERGALVGPEDAAALRAELGVAPHTKLIALLPGSRRGEVARLARPFREAAEMLTAKLGDVAFVTPTVGAVADMIEGAFAGAVADIHLLDPRGRDFAQSEARKFAAFAAADAAIAASGTVTLELAAFNTPMVVGYKASAVTEFILRRMIKINTATLVNLTVGHNAIPEYFQDDCTADVLSGATARLLTDEGARARQIAAQQAALEALGEGDAPPSLRAARSLLAAIARRSPC